MLGRALAAVAAIVLLLASLLLVWSYWALWRPQSIREVEIRVEEGAPAGVVLNQLHRAGLLPSRVAGRLYLRAFADGRSPRWGHYRFPAGSRPADVLERLLEGQVETIAVTVIEGWGCRKEEHGSWRRGSRRWPLRVPRPESAPSTSGGKWRAGAS
jgi:cell division protein YceG involved in septum cleavage